MTVAVWNSLGRARSYKITGNAISFYRNVKANGGSAMIEHKKTGRVFGTL